MVQHVKVRPTRTPTAFGPFKKGAVLCFRAEGRWWDWFIPSGPEGYRNFAADVLDIDPVVPGHPYMQLMALVPGSRDPIAIAREAHVKLPADGEVQLFANDAQQLYWNNWGAVTVSVAECTADCECPPATTDPYQGLPGAWTLARDLLERTQGILFSAVLALGACLVLAASQQGRDLVRTVGEGEFSSSAGQKLAFAVTLLFLAIQAWVWPRMVITSNYGRDRTTWRPAWLLTWLPRLLGAAPFLLVLWALKENPASNTGLIGWLVGLGLAFFVFLIIRQDLARRLPARVRSHPRLLKVGRLWVIAGALGGLVAMAWAIVDPVGMGWTLGAPGVVLLGVGLIIPVLTVAVQTGAAMRIPALGILIGSAALFSLWTDNHRVGWRAPDTTAYTVQGRMSLADAYKLWSAQAPSADGVKPLVLVASEGGASRAGYWTAEVLSALHAQSGGGLPHSLFAISSVSGGSVGAVGYAAAVQDDPSTDPAALRAPLTAFAGKDFLSPTLAGMLFPDLLQRFLPAAVLPDRAQALEAGFETAWTRHCAVASVCANPDLFKQPFLTLGPDKRGWRPIVIVNGASEETGRQVLTSRIAFTPDQIDADDFYRITGRDVAVSTAIHNGARFPWISPPGTLTRGPTANGHIVDGGYFEAGGVEVVRQLARAILRVNAAPDGPHDPLRIIIVFIGYGGTQTLEMQPPASAATKAVLGQTTPSTTTPATINAAKADAPAAQGATRRFLNEVTGPLVGLFGSRNAHASHLSRMLKLDASGRPEEVDPYTATAPGRPMTYQPVLLCDQKIGKTVNFEAPMDWALSDCARAYMREAAGAPADPSAYVCKKVESQPIPCQAFNRAAIAAIAGELRHPGPPTPDR